MTGSVRSFLRNHSSLGRAMAKKLLKACASLRMTGRSITESPSPVTIDLGYFIFMAKISLTIGSEAQSIRRLEIPISCLRKVEILSLSPSKQQTRLPAPLSTLSIGIPGHQHRVLWPFCRLFRSLCLAKIRAAEIDPSEVGFRQIGPFEASI